MRRNRFIATIAAGLGIIALVPVATALGDDSGDGNGRNVEAVTALGTGFTYQGRLTDGGSPANGTYDLRFILFDADNGGAQVGSILPKEDVSVTNGLFSVELDFGATAFNGDARWVEIAVRPGSGSGTGGYTVLSPRQPVSPTPYALFAKAAGGVAVPFAATGSSAGASTTGLVTVTQTGTGIAISGNRTSTDASLFPGVLGTNAGGGAGVQGESTSADGVGVQGFAIGATGAGGSFTGATGVEAIGSPSGSPSVNLDGPIKVSGSNPTAFVHLTTAGNTNVVGCGGAGSHCTTIDNPIINNDPNAILLVTHRWNEGESIVGIYDNNVVGVWYEPASDKWVIYHENNVANPMPVGARFNVLVIKR